MIITIAGPKVVVPTRARILIVVFKRALNALELIIPLLKQTKQQECSVSCEARSQTVSGSAPKRQRQRERGLLRETLERLINENESVARHLQVLGELSADRLLLLSNRSMLSA